MPPHHRRTPVQRTAKKKRQIKVDPQRLGRALKQRKAAGLLIALIVIVALALLDHAAGVLPVDDDWHRYHGQTFEVLRVIDGDTFDLSVPDGERATTRVRLWGVNTPEMGKPSEDTPPQPWANEATEFARDLLAGQRVTLYLQEHRLRGGYGRLLAYVRLPDGRFLNAALIENGLSKHDDRWGHDRAETYEQLEQEAREGRRGMWAR